jgi:hypothetical protein
VTLSFFDDPANPHEIKWLLTEAFTSTVPAEAFEEATSSSWGRTPERPTARQWISELIQEAGNWPEPGTRKPYWSVRTTGRASQTRMTLEEVARVFTQLIGLYAKKRGWRPAVLRCGQSVTTGQVDRTWRRDRLQVWSRLRRSRRWGGGAAMSVVRLTV